MADCIPGSEIIVMGLCRRGLNNTDDLYRQAIPIRHACCQRPYVCSMPNTNFNVLISPSISHYPNSGQPDGRTISRESGSDWRRRLKEIGFYLPENPLKCHRYILVGLWPDFNANVSTKNQEVDNLADHASVSRDRAADGQVRFVGGPLTSHPASPMMPTRLVLRSAKNDTSTPSRDETPRRESCGTGLARLVTQAPGMSYILTGRIRLW